MQACRVSLQYGLRPGEARDVAFDLLDGLGRAAKEAKGESFQREITSAEERVRDQVQARREDGGDV